MADSGEDDVPPLEDMTEEISKLKSKPSTGKPAQQQKVTQKKEIAAKKDKAKKDQDTSFGGFKKGFLNFGSSSESTSRAKPAAKPPPKQAEESTKSKASNVKSTGDDIPHIKKSKASGLELPEVQEAMKETFPFLTKNDWVTEDLVSKVEKHPNLSKVFQDPNLTDILLEFQKNPEKAMAAAKDNKEMKGFLQDFCALMGDHFTELADQEEAVKAAAEKGATPLITEVTEPSDEERVKEVLANPEVQSLLADKEVQKLLDLLKNDPEGAHKMSRLANPAFQEKIRLLIRHGLLAMQP